MQSAYGWTHKYITWHVTPAQLLVWADQIRRDEARRMADQINALVIAGAAIHGGREGFAEMNKVLRKLSIEAGDEGEEAGGKATAAARLIEALGLKDSGAASPPAAEEQP